MNPFEASRNARQQNLEPAQESERKTGEVGLLAPKPTRKQYSVYMDVELMEQIRRVARRRGVTIGAVIEACVKLALEELEG